MKILGIGESVIDKTYLFQGDIPKSVSWNTQHELHVGGPVLTAMILLARLGIECTFITTIGRDNHAKLIKKLLKREHVTLLPKYQNNTKVNTIYVDTQTGFRKKMRGSIVHKPLHGLDKKFLQQFDAVIFDRHETIAFYELLEKRSKKTKIIIDPSIEVSKYTIDMVRYADYPIIPVEFLLKLNTNLNRGLEDLYQLSKKQIIVTAGDVGSFLFNGKETMLIPAQKVKAIDATGAGDIYRGGFAYGAIQGWENQASASFANLVAGMQCTKVGNVAAIPTNADILLHAFNNNAHQSVSLPSVHAFFAPLL